MFVTCGSRAGRRRVSNKRIQDAAIRVIQIAVTDPNGAALITGDGQGLTVRINLVLNGFSLTAVAGCLTAVSTSGIPTIQLRRVRAGVSADMLSTPLTIDANESDSKDAATATVIDAANDDVVTGDQIFFDIDVAGTGAKGLIVELTFRSPVGGS